MAESAWLLPQLCRKYVINGWLERLTHGVYRKPGGKLLWEHIVISLQTLLMKPLIVGGGTALSLHGFSHYLRRDDEREIHLYGPEVAPSWLNKLPMEIKFVYHNSAALFRNEPITFAHTNLGWNLKDGSDANADPIHGGSFNVMPCTIKSARVTERRQADGTLTRLVVQQGRAQIKIEVTPVLRGSVFAPEMRPVQPSVEEEFGFAEIQVVSFADLFAGKIMAALDRQHPRDLFDIRDLLANEGISDELRQGFIVYLISHGRPIAEVIASGPAHYDGCAEDKEPPKIALPHFGDFTESVLTSGRILLWGETDPGRKITPLGKGICRRCQGFHSRGTNGTHPWNCHQSRSDIVPPCANAEVLFQRRDLLGKDTTCSSRSSQKILATSGMSGCVSISSFRLGQAPLSARGNEDRSAQTAKKIETPGRTLLAAETTSVIFQPIKVG